jgi:poly-gamma-glutamate synthesis protein (capsule biosynthesis protein)
VSDIDFSQFLHQIQFCRDHNTDLIIAQLHWGMEHEYYPRPEQVEVAHHLAEMGVDIVVGHHPHLVQPMECYRTRRDPDRLVPIFYSLGNLVTPFSHPDFRRSAVARVIATKGTTPDGKTRTYIRKADVTEVFLQIDETNRTLRLRAKSDCYDTGSKI